MNTASACAHVWSLHYPTNHSLPRAGQFQQCLGTTNVWDYPGSSAKYRADVGLKTSIKTGGGSTDFIDSGLFRTLNDGFITRPFAISSRQAWAVAMLLRTKRVGPFKSVTCLISSCANFLCPVNDAATAAVMRASAHEKYAIIDKAPSNRNIPLLLSPTPRASRSRPATCDQRHGYKISGKGPCKLERFRNRGGSAFFPYVSRGSDAVSSCMLRAQ
jgi:hypothetical protein